MQIKKHTTVECAECESVYSIDFKEESVSEDNPEYCPFCGEAIDILTEKEVDCEDDEDDEIPDQDDEWD